MWYLYLDESGDLGFDFVNSKPSKFFIDIYHSDSQQSFGLQAVDMFCWGIFQKYERENMEWYTVFAEDKVKFEEGYVSQNKKPLAGE